MVIVTETRYFRSDTQTVNGLTAYKFGITNTTTSTTASYTYYSLPLNVSISLARRRPDGTETAIPIPTPLMLTFTTPTSGMFTDYFTAFSTSFGVNDSLVVRVMMRGRGFGGIELPWTTVAIFTTTHIGNFQTSYITAYLYLDVQSTGATFYFGSADYPSRLEGITYDNPGLDPFPSEAPGCLLKI